MDGLASNRVRLVIAVLLGVPQLVVGVWAVTAPRHWFDHFPGFDPHVVAALPPFNEHLATDAGAGFLATGVALLAAAWWGYRSAVYVALLAYLALALPHFVYHIAHPSPALTSTEDAANTLLLGTGVGIAVLLAWEARPRPTPLPSRELR
jgi:hypothetical protein